MLLEALVACAGVTLKAVATALQIELRHGTVRAEGDLDFRGTLGVDKGRAGGLPLHPPRLRPRHGRPEEQIAQLIKLTERYCVIFQTLNHRPELDVAVNRA
jgi:uncharacterized OsmC-like protein